MRRAPDHLDPTTDRARRSRRPAFIGLLVAPLVTLAATACLPITRIEPPPLAKATCTTTATRSITVDEGIVNSVRRMLAAAKADGVLLCGGGYRSSDAQIAVRKTNCGTTYYDIYVKPASECSPPTAIPGTSMHEKGRAIDFDNCSTHTTACFVWLAKHAETYGFQNLPSEPWHWSTNGH